MGFFGVAVATTFMGDATLAPSVGLDTVRGKSLEPFGYGGVQGDSAGIHAGGAGSELFEGDQLIGTGGVEGYEGWLGATAILEFVPQEARARLNDVRKTICEIHDERATKETACIHQPPKTGSTHAETGFGGGELF